MTWDGSEEYTLPAHLKIVRHTDLMQQAKKEDLRDLYLDNLDLIRNVVYVTLKSETLNDSVVGTFTIDTLFIKGSSFL